MILLLLSCSGTPSEVPEETPSPDGGAHQETDNLDQGQQHPPLPADNPVWSWDAGGFVGDFGWYGEHSWADVRMRVAGHLSAAGRDLARLRASQGDLAGAAAAYQELVGILEGIKTPESGIAAEINGLLLEAARRDAALLAALAAGEVLPAAEGLDGLRMRYLELARRSEAGETVSAEARALQDELTPYLTPREDLDLDAFTDFVARHELRVRLFDAYLDSLDPLGISERWGYWEADEVVRQALLIGVAAGELGGADWSGKAAVLVGAVPTESPALTRPGLLAEHLRSPDQAATFTVEGLGWLPTGDSLIDLAGHPGPRAIGTLQKMGLDDEEHRAWLTRLADDLNADLADRPDAVVSRGREAAAWLDGHTHGSRFYNVKQVRNALVRQLARSGEPALAVSVLRDNLPLHNQDWACPNRAGILSAIEGRLLAEAGDPIAETVLRRALQEGADFLAEVDRAEAQPGYGLRAPGAHRPPGQGAKGPPGSAGPGGRGHPPGNSGSPGGGPPSGSGQPPPDRR